MENCVFKTRNFSCPNTLQVIAEKMKKKIIILFLIIPTSLIFGQNISKDSIIEWKKDNNLSWSEFLGKPNDNIIADALTSYKIEVLPSDVVLDENDNILNYQNLTVKANFYKYHSWYIENTNQLLEHEQLHFDIAELFARKMRMEFEKLKNDNESNFNIYVDCYNRLWKDCREMQGDYDFDTNHGRENEINLKWIDKINNELSKLNEFEL